MSNYGKTDSKNQKTARKQSKKRWPVFAALAAVAIAVILTAVNQNTDAAKKPAIAAQTVPAAVSQAADTFNTAAGGNVGEITIVKKDITEKASFIPYKIGNTQMEIVAVMAPDGTVRTALNTCQVCWNSGRGYYKQEGGELVCQNCGNRFKISQIEKMKNGCNPVPITSENKTDDGDTIRISGDELAKYKGFFEKK